MKYYFIGTRINYVYNNWDEEYTKEEYYSFIVQARSKVEARKQAYVMSKHCLMNEFDNIKQVLGVVVTDCYITSEDARTN